MPCTDHTKSRQTWEIAWSTCTIYVSCQIEGALAYFTHINRQKRIVEDDVGEVKYVFTTKKHFILFYFFLNDPPIRFIHLIMQEYDSKCLKMYLITLKAFKICKKMFAPITKVNEGESNIPCPSTVDKWHTPQVEKLSKALRQVPFLDWLH
jgi:hypothetical protein